MNNRGGRINRAMGIIFPAVFWLLGTLFLLSAFRFLSVFDVVLRVVFGIGFIILAVVIRRETKREEVA